MMPERMRNAKKQARNAMKLPKNKWHEVKQHEMP